MAPSSATLSVRWSHTWYTQNRSPKSGTWITTGSTPGSNDPTLYTTSWFGQATIFSVGVT